MKTPNFSQTFDTASVHLALQNLTADRLRPLPLAAKVELAAIFERIAASGEKATDYIDLKYGVSETRFKSWPETLKKPFEAARTVTPGKPRFAIRHIGEDK